MNGTARFTRAEVQARSAAIAAELGVPVRLDEPLAPLVSMRLGGPAAALLLPGSARALSGLVARLSAEGVPHRLLGGGSNLLVGDGPLDFAVIAVSAAATPAAVEWTADGVRAPAGLPLAHLVSEAVRRGLAGLEWAAGLPGTLGGAVFGNAGAFGGDIGRSVTEVLVMSPGGGLRSHVVAPGDFSYRDSFVREGELVLEVALRLTPSTPDAVREETNRVNRTRAGSQPKGGHSSGCIFRNPVPLSAGRLVDECGLKGRRVGGAFVSPSHGNFIINDGTATAADVLELISIVRAEVLRQKGVELELEVQVWASGDSPDAGSAP